MNDANTTSVAAWEFVLTLVFSPIILVFWFGVLMVWSVIWSTMGFVDLIGALLYRQRIDAALSSGRAEYILRQ